MIAGSWARFKLGVSRLRGRIADSLNCNIRCDITGDNANKNVPHRSVHMDSLKVFFFAQILLERARNFDSILYLQIEFVCVHV